MQPNQRVYLFITLSTGSVTVAGEFGMPVSYCVTDLRQLVDTIMETETGGLGMDTRSAYTR